MEGSGGGGLFYCAKLPEFFSNFPAFPLMVLLRFDGAVRVKSIERD